MDSFLLKMTGVASIPDRTQLTALYSYLHPMGYGEIFEKKLFGQTSAVLCLS